MKNKIAKCFATAALVALPFAGAHAGAGNNHAALFMGATITDDYTDPTVGVEYEYRTPFMDRKIGIGVVVEQLLDHDATIAVAGVVIHPWKDLKVNLSAGIERLDVAGTTKNKELIRVGVGYDFHYNNISYGPVYNLDTVDGNNAHAVGLAVGFGF